MHFHTKKRVSYIFQVNTKILRLNYDRSYMLLEYRGGYKIEFEFYKQILQ